MKKVVLWILAAVMTLSLAAAASARPSASEAQSQERVYREVRHELVMLPRLTIFDNLEYQVNGDTVTLFGQVRNPVLKDEAAQAVKGIEGVRQVNNQIEVLPVSFNDDGIRRRVARAIFRDDQLFRYSLGALPSIHIIVKNGNVSLVGVVDSQSDKNVAGIRANGVPGVFSVANDLKVQKAVEARK